MLKLLDAFAISSTLFENDATIIYRAIRQVDGCKVILKTHKRREDTHKIKHEYDLLKGQNIAGTSNVIDIFGSDDEMMYLVSEDRDAVVLEDYLRSNDGDDMSFLRIAENASEALASIHANRIVHRDIKPANMLVNPQTLEVWYIDFGISVKIKRGIEVWQESVEGTLEYLSPEQTGRVNKAIDYRSDIYSLGVVFYRAMTGKLPFSGSTPMELIHAHIAMAPVPPIELVKTQPIISDGILKMLEKKPEDRYQTAESMAYDIRRCRLLLEEGKDCNAFRMAEKDIFYNLEPGRKLYGKLDILDDLKRHFDGIEESRVVLALLDGTDAVGKTMMLSELEWHAMRHNSLVFRAETNQYGHDEPYHALRNAFAHFDALIYGSKLSLSAYRESILSRLEENAQVLIEILPQMESVLGRQQPVPKLSPSATQRRAEQVFRAFMRIICDVPCPCLFLFDDVQWVDEASLRLLFAALEDRDLGNCMVVLSYRDDDFATGKRLNEAIAQHGLRHIDMVTCHIQPLRPEDITGILLDIFPQPRESAEALAQHVYSFSKGNMRKVEQYLKELYHTGVIVEDGADGQWRWRPDAINPAAFEDLREQIATLYKGLPQRTTECLDMLATFDVEATREEIEIIFAPDRSADEIIQAMRPLEEKNLWAYQERTKAYAFDGRYARELFCGMAPEEEQRRLHGHIWRRLYAHYEEDQAALLRNCALITEHFLKAGLGRVTEQDRMRIMRLNRQAGDEAMQASNMEKANGFYANALPLLGDEPLVLHYNEALGLMLSYAACIFALDDTKAATAMYQSIIVHARNEKDRYEAYRQLVSQYLSIADWIHAEAYTRAYLSGSPVMPDESGDMAAQIKREEETFARHEAEKGIEYFLTAEMSDDPAVLRYGSMLSILTESMIVNINPNSLYYIYKALNYAYENGVFPDVERALGMLAERVATHGEYQRAKHIFDCGIAYAERHGAPQSVLWAAYCAVIVHWVEPLSSIPAVYQKAKRLAMLEGNLYYSAFADLMLLEYGLFSGENLSQIARDVEAAIYNCERSNFTRFRFVFSVVFRQFIRCMTGRTKGMDSFDDRFFNEAEAEAETEEIRWAYTMQFYIPYRMQALFTYGYYEEAVAYAQKLHLYEGEGERYNAILCRVLYCYYYTLALIRLCAADPSRKEGFLPIIEKNQAEMAGYAKAMPENFDMCYRLLAAELRRLDGFTLADIKEYSEIDKGLEATNFLWDRAIIEESLMDYWISEGLTHYRDIHSQNAMRFYRAIGCKLKAMQFAGYGGEEERFDSPTISTTTVMTSTGLSLTTDTTYSASLDYQAILRVISCLVSESELDDLMAQLLSLLLENAGADQGLLFLMQGGELQLSAFRYSDRHTLGLMSQELPVALDAIAADAVPHKVVEHTVSKQVTVIANAANNEYVFLGDPYLEAHRPESFICLPMVAKGMTIGAVYLENARLPGIFPPPRVSFLQAIVLQSALLLQNALDMQSLEGYTVDLEKRLTSYIGQLNTLIAGIAHEINSPLGVCVTVATRLLERTQEVLGIFEARTLSKAAFEEYLTESNDGLDILTNNITRASDLVQNFKRISVNQSNEVFEALDLIPTLRNIVEYIRPAVKRVIESCTVTGPEPLMFYTSTGVLAQIFTNLIMNSSIHAFPGMEKRDCFVTIDVTEDDDFVHIVYADNGRGMSAEEKEKVFMPFFTTRRSEGGSGLGGHIVLTLVTQTLGGSIHCISTPQRGTSFIMKLPKRRDGLEEETHNG